MEIAQRRGPGEPEFLENTEVDPGTGMAARALEGGSGSEVDAGTEDDTTNSDSTVSTTENSPVDFHQGESVDVRISGSPAEFQIDGEDCGKVSAFSARVLPRIRVVRVAD